MYAYRTSRWVIVVGLLFWFSSIAAGQTKLTWKSPTTNEDGSPLTNLAGFILHCGKSSGVYGRPVVIPNPAATTHPIAGVCTGVGIRFVVVTAYNTAGHESVLSNEVKFRFPESGASFNGVDDLIDLGNLGLTQPATFSAWLTPLSTSEDRRILSQASGATSQSGSLTIKGSTKEDFDIFVWNGKSWLKLVDLTADWSGERHLLTVVYRADGQVTAYWDAVLKTTVTASADFATASLVVGGQFRGRYGLPYLGDMDDIAIWNTELTQSEIDLIFNGASPATIKKANRLFFQ